MLSLCYSNRFSKLPYGDHAHINLSFVFTLTYMICYVIMEPLAGSLGAGLVGIIYLYTGHLVHTELVVLGSYSGLDSKLSNFFSCSLSLRSEIILPWALLS
jgi:hypothetical protein